VNSSEQYKRQIMNDLSQGNVEGLDDAQMNPSKNTKTLMILPSAHHMKNAANCLDALTSRPHPLAKWSQNSKRRSLKLNQMNGMM